MVGYLRQSARFVSQVHVARLDVHLSPELAQAGVRIEYLGGDRVAGFDTWFDGFNARQQRDFRACWQLLKERLVLKEGFDQEHSKSFGDVLCFLATVQQCRYAVSSRSLRRADALRIKLLKDDLNKWVAEAVDVYLINIYGPLHRTDKPPPALRRQVEEHAPGGVRKYVQLQADAIWQLLVDARCGGVSVPQLILTRGLDAHAGCTTSRGEVWQNKLDSMYRDRRSGGFDESYHINLVVIHDGRGRDISRTVVPR